MVRVAAAEIERQHRQTEKEGVDADVHAAPSAEIDAPTGKITHGLIHEQVAQFSGNAISADRIALRPSSRASR